MSAAGHLHAVPGFEQKTAHCFAKKTMGSRLHSSLNVKNEDPIVFFAKQWVVFCSKPGTACKCPAALIQEIFC